MPGSKTSWTGAWAVAVDDTDVNGLQVFDWNEDGAPDLLTSKAGLIQSALADP